MEKGERRKTAIVVGAGVGGVATAARLAKAGFKVTVLEKNDFTGGRCSLIHDNGYRFDQGPSLLLLPGLFEEAFRDLDTTMDAEGIHLHKCDPNYNIWFGDGERFEMSTDLAKMKREIERWEGKGGFERYLGYLAESHTHYEASVVHVLKKNFMNFAAMLRPGFLRYLYSLHVFESVWRRASMYFKTERLRRVFTFASMYMGMSPFEAPGTYSLLQYTELAEGIWYPEGGFHKVVEGLVNIGKRTGVEYRLSTPISQILVSNGVARGVQLESGETMTADIVICNADLVYAYNNLLPTTSYAKSLAKRETSCSSISFYWALDRVVPELSAHNIFLADEYRESFDSIFKDHAIPEKPSFYMHVPSRVDASAAPAGKDAVVVLVPVGHLLESGTQRHRGSSGSDRSDAENTTSAQDWEAMVSLARTTVLDTLRARIGVDLAPLIAREQINNPVTWQARFNLDRGAILGISHSFFNVLAFRPKTRHANVKGLYFVGASTHPGTGVPICLAGSKIVGEQILGDLGMPVPWDAGEFKRRSVSDIDRVEGSGWAGLLRLALLLVMLFVVALLMVAAWASPRRF